MHSRNKCEKQNHSGIKKMNIYVILKYVWKEVIRRIGH